LGTSENSTLMDRLFKLLRSVEELSLFMFATIILKYIFVNTFEQTEFTSNIYFWVQRLMELQAVVIAFNCISTKYYRIALPACSIALMSFINECLHLFNIVGLNNQYLLTFEFLILLLFVWRISKVYSSSY